MTPAHDERSLLRTSYYYEQVPEIDPDLVFRKTCLQLEEVIFKDRVFQTKNGQDLFTTWQKSECCGPSLDLRFRNPYQRDVVSLYLNSNGGCCRGQTYLKVNDQSANHIGNVKIVTFSRTINVSIERGNGEPVFHAKLPISLDSNDHSTIEILGMDGSEPVAYITKEKEGKSSQVIFHFLLNMEAALKAVILAAFLYVSLHIREMSRSRRSDDTDFSWADAGGVDFADMSHGHFGGSDWGGGGGEDCGGGGGDCGGGDCGGGDCGGGDCGGGDGGGGDGGGGD